MEQQHAAAVSEMAVTGSCTADHEGIVPSAFIGTVLL